MERNAFWLLFVTLVVNAIYNAFLPINPDEAYYWLWSKKLQLSYFDHPPLIAYFIKLFTLFSNHVFFIRLTNIFCIGGGAWFLYCLAFKMFDAKAAFYTLWIFLIVIAVQVGLVITTVDSVLVLFWCASLFFTYKFLFENHQKSVYLNGLCIGLAMLGKYTAVLLPVSLVLFLIVSKYRTNFFKKKFYICVILAVTVFSPVIFWNAQNDWISFTFQLDHGIQKKHNFSWTMMWKFLAGSMAVFHPILSFVLFGFIAKNLRQNLTDSRMLFLLLPLFFVLPFFAYNAGFTKAEINWALPGFLSAGVFLGHKMRHMKKTLLASTGLTVLAVFIVKLAVFLPIDEGLKEFKQRFISFEAFKSKLKVNPKKYDYILGEYHGRAADLAYALQMPNKITIVTPERFSQFDLWRAQDFGVSYKKWQKMLTNEEKFPIKQALFIGKDGYDRPGQHFRTLKKLFKTVKKVQSIVLQATYSDKNIYELPYIEYQVYECKN